MRPWFDSWAGKIPWRRDSYSLQYSWASPVKNLLAIQENWVWSLGWEDPLEESIATHSSILAWRTPMDRGAECGLADPSPTAGPLTISHLLAPAGYVRKGQLVKQGLQASHSALLPFAFISSSFCLQHTCDVWRHRSHLVTWGPKTHRWMEKQKPGLWSPVPTLSTLQWPQAAFL